MNELTKYFIKDISKSIFEYAEGKPYLCSVQEFVDAIKYRIGHEYSLNSILQILNADCDYKWSKFIIHNEMIYVKVVLDNVFNVILDNHDLTSELNDDAVPVLIFIF
jgi:hypothetical protein